MKFSTFILLLTWCINQSFAMDVDAQGYKIQRESIAPSLSLVCAKTTASPTALKYFSNISTQRVDKKRIVPISSDRLLNLVPALAQFPKEIWQNIIMPYTMSYLTQNIPFDLNRFHSGRTEWAITFPGGFKNHSGTKYLDNISRGTDKLHDSAAIFDTQTKEISHSIAHGISYSVWAPNDCLIACQTKNTVLIIDACSGLQTPLPNARGTSMAWNSASTHLATFVAHKKVAIWDVQALEKPIAEFTPKKMGATLLLTPNNIVILESINTAPIEIWNPFTGKVINSLQDSKRITIEQCILSPSGHYLAARSNDTIRIWNIETGKLEHRFNGLEEEREVIFSWSDNDYYLTMQQDNQRTHIFDIRTGNKRSIIPPGEINPIAGYQIINYYETPASWNDSITQLTVYSGTNADTYDFKDIHTFDDGRLTQAQSLLFWVLNKYKEKHDDGITLESIARDYSKEQITKKDLWDVLISFPPKIRLAIIQHYKIRDAFWAVQACKPIIEKTQCKSDTKTKQNNEQITATK